MLPLLRGVFANSPECFRNGEIRLVDREASRAEAVGKLLSACPEYRNVNCSVRWSDDLEACLPGTEVSAEDVVRLITDALGAIARRQSRAETPFVSLYMGYGE